MIKSSDIKNIANTRIDDSEILFNAQKYDGSFYICGYAIELGLKYRICMTLNWDGFPSTKAEFEGYSSFKTHEFKVLLRLSGKEKYIKSKFFSDWNIVVDCDPEDRYEPIGSISQLPRPNAVGERSELTALAGLPAKGGGLRHRIK